jgi:hypothetical protein
VSLILAAVAGGVVTYIYAYFAHHGHACARCGQLAGHLSLRCDSYEDDFCPYCHDSEGECGGPDCGGGS